MKWLECPGNEAETRHGIGGVLHPSDVFGMFLQVSKFLFMFLGYVSRVSLADVLHGDL